ncbi:MAG: aldo/keto reductase [Planctomycetes bacterium]|nr:aldo/keto reductase [Planctomycetota bacterium]MBL7041698.1 aldo/keto reductase [Pirellulaceae bacterium]
MNPLETRELGKTGIQVPAMGLGGTSHGGMFGLLEDKQAAVATVEHAYNKGARYFDLAPMYGYGQAETLFGQFLKTVPRDSFVLSTKVGDMFEAGEKDPDNKHVEIWITEEKMHSYSDFSRDGVLRCFEGSLQRLGIDRVDILFIHDPDVQDRYQEVMDEGFPTLAQLRDQGVVRAIGVGMNSVDMMIHFANNADFDCFLVAGRYTLLDQAALGQLLPICESKQIGVIIGGAYNSGILATGTKEGALYDYVPARPPILEKVRRIEAVCRAHQVPLQAAALQFPFGHPTVASNIPGTRSKARFDQNFDMMSFPIPADFWAELKHEGLLGEDVPTPGPALTDSQ